jgi:hypothetical protein
MMKALQRLFVGLAALFIAASLGLHTHIADSAGSGSGLRDLSKLPESPMEVARADALRKGTPGIKITWMRSSDVRGLNGVQRYRNKADVPSELVSEDPWIRTKLAPAEATA